MAGEGKDSDKENVGEKDDLGIRIIEDEAKEVEEVVRLDAPKRGPVEKKGRVAADSLMVTVQEEGAEKGEKVFLDPETEWLQDLENKETRRVPMGWFVLLGVGLIGVMIWVATQSRSGSGEEGEDTGEVEASTRSFLEKPLGKMAEIEAREAAEKHFEDMENVVRGFLAAKTVEERVKYVRHPGRVLPLMKRYYETEEFVSAEYEVTKEYHVASLEFRPFLALKVRDTNGEEHALLVEDSEEGLMVDWESFVCYQPISPETYSEERPTEPVSLRAYVIRDHYYAHEFEDEEEYACFRLNFRGSKIVLYGYVKRGTMLDEQFRKVLPPENPNLQKPMILKIRFPEGGRALRAVVIEELESQLWAFPQNPDEVDSEEKSE